MTENKTWKAKKHGLQNRSGKLWLLDGDLAFELFAVHTDPSKPNQLNATFNENMSDRIKLSPDVAGRMIDAAIGSAFRSR